MQILNLSGYGINVHVDGGKLVVRDGNTHEKEPQEQRFRRKMLNFDKLVISGNTGNITIPAIRWLMKQKRDIALVDWNGRLIASVSAPVANLGTVKLSQYEAHSDPKKQALIAKWIIKQKIDGTLRVLEFIKTIKSEFTFDQIKKYALEINHANDLRSVLRIESAVSQHYWRSLSSVFDKKWEFISRNFGDNKDSKDADDPINALFNYGYAILESECWKVANTVGLEPYVGFIHKTHTNRAPLIYDLQEPFRWLVEMSILKILFEKKIKMTDFITTDEGNVRLKPSAVKIVLDEIAKQFSAKTAYKGMMREWQTMILIRTRELVHLF
ncbi:MAG: CRISPR-associated endonuclease Cas1 [Nitrosotalea sp.]